MNKLLLVLIVGASVIAFVAAIPVQQNADSLAPEAQPELLQTAASARRARGFGFGGVGISIGGFPGI